MSFPHHFPCQIVEKTEIRFMHPLRAGKKLCVLDLDLTLFDMKSQAASFAELKRPFTDEFLTALYEHYDLCIWSQTSWRWLEVKLTELGLLTHPAYVKCPRII
jgi:ubiquitin-like domain-containing CTD phosphatase 1